MKNWHIRYMIKYGMAGILFLPSIYKNVTYNIDLQSAALMIFGGIRDIDSKLLTTILFENIVPMLFYIYIYAQNFHSDFKINYVYVFTRQNNRSRWLNKKIWSLMLENLCSWMVLFVLFFLFSKVYLLKINGNIILYISLFFNDFFSAFLITLFLNCLSLVTGSSKSFLITTMFYLFSLIVGILNYYNNAINEKLCLCLLPLNGMYLWHDSLPISSEIINALPQPIKYFTFEKSVIASLIWFLFIYTTANYMLKHMDLGILKGD